MHSRKKHTLADIYKKYDNKFNLSEEEFKEIIKTFNNLLMKSIIETGYIYKLPFKLGTLSVRRKKTVGKCINFNHYMKTGEKIYYTNKHSGGYHGAFYWDRKAPQGIFARKFFYRFFPTRFYKRYLSSAIRDRNTIIKYFEYE